MTRLFLVLICAISCGCRDSDAPQPRETQATKPQAAVKLTVLVVDDVELATGIGLLAGEWSERSGGELSVQQMLLNEMLSAEKLSADVVIYPSRHLGTLAMRGWLRPVRQSVLDAPELAWGDFLSIVRDQTIRYGTEVLALPLGEMPLAMAWRGEVPQKLPATWQQLGNHVARAEKTKLLQYPLTAELLVRALATCAVSDRASLLFDGQTLDAKLTRPQLVRALEQMKVLAEASPYSASVALPRDANTQQLSPLLSSDEIFNESLERWEKNDTTGPSAICGFAGRVASVTTASRNAASAFKLLPWLVSGTNGSQLSKRSRATLWCRASQVAQAEKWLGGKIQDDRSRWLTEVLSHGEAFLLPRIPGIDQYLETLEAALAKVLSGDQSAEDGLAQTAEQWDRITDRLGREQQRTAFHRHLGLVE